MFLLSCLHTHSSIILFLPPLSHSWRDTTALKITKPRNSILPLWFSPFIFLPLTSNACVIFVATAKKNTFLKNSGAQLWPISPTLSEHGMCIFRHSSSQFLILVQWISPSMCLCFVPQHQPYYLWLFLHFPALHSPKADTNQTDFFHFFSVLHDPHIFWKPPFVAFYSHLVLSVAVLFIFLISFTTCQFILFFILT